MFCRSKFLWVLPLPEQVTHASPRPRCRPGNGPRPWPSAGVWFGTCALSETRLSFQIRKQQKEHAELIEDYRIKQQQCALAPPAVLPGVPPPPAMGQPSFPMVPQPLQPHAAVLSGHSSPARMPGLPGWQPPSAPAHLPLNPRMQPPVAQLPMKPCTPAPGAVPSASPQGGPPPRVEFDDNNPFSEGFQERERKERLREQQERQRIQLMQEVDRQRALQQRLELEQHGLMGSEPGGRTSMAQTPFYGPDLPCDFMQAPRPIQQSPQRQQPGVPPGPMSSPPAQPFMQAGERRPGGAPAFVPDSPSVPGSSPNFHSAKQVHGGLPGASFQQSPARPPFTPALPTAPPGASSSLPCGQDPAVTHSQSYSGPTQSLIQLYSDIIPEEKGKKKRTRKKKKDEDAESTRAPSTPHSDITAPPTPSVSEATSTPTGHTPGELPPQAEPDLVERAGPSAPGAAAGQPGPELEHPQPGGDLSQAPSDPQTQAGDAEPGLAEPEQRPGPDRPVAEEPSGEQVAEKAGAGPASAGHTPPQAAGPPAKGDAGNELLKHLLKSKKAAALLSQRPEGAPCAGDHTGDGKPAERQGPAERPVSGLVPFVLSYEASGLLLRCRGPGELPRGSSLRLGCPDGSPGPGAGPFGGSRERQGRSRSVREGLGACSVVPCSGRVGWAASAVVRVCGFKTVRAAVLVQLSVTPFLLLSVCPAEAECRTVGLMWIL